MRWGAALAFASVACAQTEEEALVRAVLVAEASYCMESASAPVLPPSLEDVAVDAIIEVQDERAIVGYDARKKSLFVSFRGTSNLANWLENVDGFKTSPYDDDTDAEVMEGMSDWYHDLKGGVVSALAKAKDARFPGGGVAPLYATGHSAGGACATLFSIDVWRGNVTGYALTTAFSFGSPRLGNAAFAAFFDKARDAAGARSYRVTHADDVIPHLPQQLLGFLHVPGEFWQQNDTVAVVACADSTSAEDPACSDSCAPLDCTSKADHLRYLGVPLGKHGCAS